MSSSIALHLILLKVLSPSKKLAIMGRLACQRALGSICLYFQCRDHGYTALLGLLPGYFRFTLRSSCLQSQLSYPLSHLFNHNNIFTEVRLTERNHIPRMDMLFSLRAQNNTFIFLQFWIPWEEASRICISPISLWSHFFCIVVTNLTKIKGGRFIQHIVPVSFFPTMSWSFCVSTGSGYRQGSWLTQCRQEPFELSETYTFEVGYWLSVTMVLRLCLTHPGCWATLSIRKCKQKQKLASDSNFSVQGFIQIFKL